MGYTARRCVAFVVFYICLVSCTTVGDFQLTESGDSLTIEPSNVSSEQVSETTAATLKPTAPDSPDNVAPTVEASLKAPTTETANYAIEVVSGTPVRSFVNEVRFVTQVRLNVTHMTRSTRCCGFEARETSNSSVTLSLLSEHQGSAGSIKCSGCKAFGINTARCHIPKTKYPRSIGVQEYSNWSCASNSSRKLVVDYEPRLEISCDATKHDGDHNICISMTTCHVTVHLVSENGLVALVLQLGQRRVVAMGIFVFTLLLVTASISVLIYVRRAVHPKPYASSTSDA